MMNTKTEGNTFTKKIGQTVYVVRYHFNENAKETMQEKINRMLEGLHRLLANRYQFTISERSRRNLEAAMADSDNLTQFMQAQAYVRFRPDSEERSTYLYRAYTKWCEDNLESPVPQKKFSQFLLKNAGKYGLTFSKHIEGKYRGFRGVCVHPAFAAA